MSHDTHFLTRLERVSPVEADLAMSLYREPLLVRVLLDHAELPAGTDRCAIALRNAPDGPHVVVARDGHFVTCLGAGMSLSGLPVVTRAKVDSVNARARLLLDRIDTAREALGEDFAQIRFFRRLHEAAHAVSREEISGALGLAPLVAPDYLWVFGDFLRGIGLSRTQARLARKERHLAEAPRRYWQRIWAGGHFGLLMTADVEALTRFAGEHVDTVARGLATATLSGPVATTARMLWACGHLGRHAVPALKAAVKSDQPGYIGGAFCLATIALGHGRYEAEVRKVLDPERPEGSLLLDVLEHPDTYRERMLQDGRALGVQLTKHLAPGSRWHFPTPESVPDELAAAFLASSFDPVLGERDGFLQVLHLLPWLARAKPEELYLPADLLAALNEEWEPWMTERLLEATPRTHEPAVRAEQPGRNDPCGCKSGRKFKKCCGAAA